MKYLEDFKQIAEDEKKQYINANPGKKICYQKQCCKDIVVGRNGEFWFGKAERANQTLESLEISEEPDTKTIVIVLESPHKDEFNILKSVDEIVNSNPALGRTGRMLEKYFTKDNLEKKLKEDHICDEMEQKYRVILMNSIQYQCSLGASPELFRDKIWFRLWFEKNFYEDFMDRLKRYEPDIIINLCTKIKFTKEQIMNIDDKELKEKLLKGDLWNARSIVAFYINKVIDEKKEIIVYEGNHPAGWSENFDSIHLVF